jgi:hypothetical protein
VVWGGAKIVDKSEFFFCVKPGARFWVSPATPTPAQQPLNPYWTAHASNVLYSQALLYARKRAHQGYADEYSAGVVGALHLLHAIDDVQYLAFKNEIEFLQRRNMQRAVEAMVSTDRLHPIWFRHPYSSESVCVMGLVTDSKDDLLARMRSSTDKASSGVARSSNTA